MVAANEPTMVFLGLAGTGELLDRLVQCSGRVPLISLVLGPVVGVSALAASLAGFAILGEDHGNYSYLRL